MEHTLRGLSRLLTDADATCLPDGILTAILDQYAPIGIKKMMILRDLGAAADLTGGALPPYRKIQEADESEILDEVGEHLHTIARVPVGRIPDHQRLNVLNTHVVAPLYAELERLVASLDSEGLLEWLVAHHEAITRDIAFHHLQIPTRLACFSSEPKLVAELMNEMPERSKAGLASRFIIEYTAARPPATGDPISLSVYDRLQAIAWHIINYGFMSDIIHYGLVDLKLSMLPSERLGVDQALLRRAFDAYGEAFSVGQIAKATQSFSRSWPGNGSTRDSSPLLERLEAACVQEFGHSLRDLPTLMGRAIDIAVNLNPICACLPTNDLRARLVEATGWPHEKVRRILESLTLGPRDAFLKPPQPYRKEDVWPWRFNRPMSYLRRPFLSRQRGGVEETVWGMRHLFTAAHYLMNLAMSGRLHANSDELRRILGEINNQRGKEFNDEVADLLTGDGGVTVKRKVTRVGNLPSIANTLGDIDVLEADPRKRQVRVIECKALALARTPYEMASEIEALFHGPKRVYGKD
jgi:hypothetical protein